MKYSAHLYAALSLLCIWNSQNFVLAAFQQASDNFLSKETFVCDYSHLESQLETLKTGHDFLILRMEMLKVLLNKQKDLFNSLDRHINELPKQIQTMQDKLLQDNKVYFEELRDFLQKQMHNQVPAIQPVDDKLYILADIKQMLKNHHAILESIVSNQNNTQNLLREPKWDNKLQTLETKLTLLDKVDGKLTNIENGLMTKAENVKLYRDIQRYFNKHDATKVCYKDENHNLLCTSQTYPTNCADFNVQHCMDNKCRISNHLYGPESFLVSCNDREEGGGWTVIQRRINGSVDFYRNWSEYKNGFGHVDGELFIGLDKLHALTSTLQPMELLIQMEDFNNTMKYAKYDDFQIGNETENYKLIKLGSYSGNAGDSLSFHEGRSFSTKDRDNDEDNTANCAIDKTGAWWYKSCMWSNLNGKYYTNGATLPKGERGICWGDFHGYDYSLKFVQMMIRPRRL